MNIYKLQEIIEETWEVSINLIKLYERIHSFIEYMKKYLELDQNLLIMGY